MTTAVDFSHDFPMPKNHKIRCSHYHLSEAQYESPIRCQQCQTPEVVWVRPPALKLPSPARFPFPSGERKV